MSLAKKRRKRLRRRLGNALLFLLAVCGAVALWLAPFWHFQNLISVSGNRTVPTDRILRQAMIQPATLFRIDPVAVRSRIEQIPEIEKALVRRWLFPARLEIDVTERHPFAQIASGSLFLDLSGIPFQAPAQHTPIQVLMSSTRDVRALQSFRAIAARWPKDVKGLIDLRSPEDIRIDLQGLVARFGKGEDIEEKFQVLFRLLPLAKRYGNRLEYVDLRFPQSPTLKCKPACKETGNSPSLSSPSP
ncbi:MAG: cell division protein FtsQ/DivIB [Bacteroidota bacterium]